MKINLFIISLALLSCLLTPAHSSFLLTKLGVGAAKAAAGAAVKGAVGAAASKGFGFIVSQGANAIKSALIGNLIKGGATLALKGKALKNVAGFAAKGAVVGGAALLGAKALQFHSQLNSNSGYASAEAAVSIDSSASSPQLYYASMPSSPIENLRYPLAIPNAPSYVYSRR